MKNRKTMGLLLALFLPLIPAHSKGKKHAEMSVLFASARYVYVQAVDGDITRPSLYPEDRDAISDVQQAVRDWNRYAITTERDQADLVFIVRKGRTLGTQVHGGVSAGTPSHPGSQRPGQLPQVGDSDVAGVGTEVGPADDLLRVYSMTPDGKLSGPLWSREWQGGLDGPSVPLVHQLKESVEAAYPPKATSPSPKP